MSIKEFVKGINKDNNYIDAVKHNFKNGNVAIELWVDDAGKG